MLYWVFYEVYVSSCIGVACYIVIRADDAAARPVTGDIPFLFSVITVIFHWVVVVSFSVSSSVTVVVVVKNKLMGGGGGGGGEAELFLCSLLPQGQYSGRESELKEHKL